MAATAVPHIDKIGFVSKNLGLATALAIALGTSDGASRTGFYGDLTGGSEKLGVVVNAVEIGAFTATGLELNLPLRLEGSTSGSTTIQVAAVAGGPFTLTLPTTAGAAGDVLTTDGAGVLSWETPSTPDLSGSIEASQIAYGSATDTIAGNNGFVYDATNGRLGIDGGVGLFAPQTTVHIRKQTNAGYRADAYSGSGLPGVQLYRARGTIASPTAVTTGDTLGFIGGYGWHSGGAFATTSRAKLEMKAGQAWTNAAQGTYLSLWTTPNSSTTPVEGLRLFGDGTVQIGGTYTAGLGAGALWVSTRAKIGSPTFTSSPVHAFELGTPDGTIGLQATNATSWSGVNMYDNAGTLAASFQYGNSSASVFADQYFIAARKTTTPIILATCPVSPLAFVYGTIIYPNGGVQIGSTYGTSPGVGNLAIFGTQNTPSQQVPLLVSAAGLPYDFSAMTETTAIIVGPSGARARLMLDCYKNGGALTLAPILTFRSTAGTAASPVAVRTGELLANLSLQAYDGTDYNTASKGFMTAWAASTWTNTSHPYYVDISTTDTSATDVGITRMRVWQDGGVQIGSTYTSSPGAGNLLLENGRAAVFETVTTSISSFAVLGSIINTATGATTTSTQGGNFYAALAANAPTAGTKVAHGAQTLADFAGVGNWGANDLTLYGLLSGARFTDTNGAFTATAGSVAGVAAPNVTIGISNSGTTLNLTGTTGLAAQGAFISVASGSTVTITDMYGIYVGAPSISGAGTVTITNRWGVYQDDTAALNYFGGVVYTTSTFYAQTDALTDASTINYVATASDNFTLLLTSAIGVTRALATPTGLVSGMRWVIRVKQPASGGPCDLTYSADYKFVNGYTPVLTTSANAVDVISCYYDGTDILTQVTQSYGTTVAALDIYGATLDIDGAVNLSNVVITSSTTLGITHYTVAVDASAGAVVITLPDTTTTGVPGRVYHIKKIDSSANAVTIQRSGSDVIDGATSVAISTQYTCYTVHARTAGGAWDII